MEHGFAEEHENEGIEEVEEPGTLGIAAWNRAEDDTAPDTGTLNTQSERANTNMEKATNILEELLGTRRRKFRVS